MADHQLDGIARLERALLDGTDVHDQIAQLLLRVTDPEQSALRPLDEALVADLSAGLAIEGRLVENQRTFLAALEALGRLAALDDSAHLAFGRLRLVA